MRKGLSGAAAQVYRRAAADVSSVDFVAIWHAAKGKAQHATDAIVGAIRPLFRAADGSGGSNAPPTGSADLTRLDKVLTANGLRAYAGELHALGADDVAGLCLVTESDVRSHSAPDTSGLVSKPIHLRKLMRLIGGALCSGSGAGAAAGAGAAQAEL